MFSIKLMKVNKTPKNVGIIPNINFGILKRKSMGFTDLNKIIKLIEINQKFKINPVINSES